MNQAQFTYTVRGVYTLAEAASLSAVPSKRLRRWTGGYRYLYKGEFRYRPPPVAA